MPEQCSSDGSDHSNGDGSDECCADFSLLFAVDKAAEAHAQKDRDDLEEGFVFPDFLDIGAEQGVVLEAEQAFRVALQRGIVTFGLAVDDKGDDSVGAPERDKVQDLLVDPGGFGARR